MIIATAKQSCMISFGAKLKARVMINPGQNWIVVCQPTDEDPFYTLTRPDITISITPEDYDKIFK